MAKNGGSLSNLLFQKSNFIEIILSSIFIALGINLISNSISIIEIDFLPILYLIIGIVFCILSFLYLIYKLFLKKRTVMYYIDAFLVYDKNSNNLIDIPRYNFSEELKSYLEAACTEDKGIETIWENEPLNLSIDELNKNKGSKNLIIEAAEYFFLSKFSTHLSDYFNKPIFRSESLMNFDRNSIPEILLKNRFMELFSKPMEQRYLFLKERYEKKNKLNNANVESNSNQVIYSSIKTEDGWIFFEEFDLILPKKSKIERTKKNIIVLDIGRFIIEFSTDFKGFSTNMPDHFEDYYLGYNSINLDPFKITFKIKISFKTRRLLFGKGWHYYEWIDSFIKYLEEESSQEKYFEKIGWEQTLTILECINPQITDIQNKISKLGESLEKKPEVLGQKIASIEEDSEKDQLLETSLTEEIVLSILTHNWQTINSLIFKLRIKDMMKARYLQTLLNKLYKNGRIEEKLVKSRKHFRLPKKKA